ncbi:hypothetical protein PIB30_102898 [Stylosanthes scabra]|uniref:Uncharacterized protein n=1 Tax=Stylosanthes scabra TaxID=79078 RepID=A0ABU6QZF6_9FABA|nr:hypothetical protein [Stylosanthes scabra]
MARNRAATRRPPRTASRGREKLGKHGTKRATDLQAPVTKLAMKTRHNSTVAEKRRWRRDTDEGNRGLHNELREEGSQRLYATEAATKGAELMEVGDGELFKPPPCKCMQLNLALCVIRYVERNKLGELHEVMLESGQLIYSGNKLKLSYVTKGVKNPHKAGIPTDENEKCKIRWDEESVRNRDKGENSPVTRNGVEMGENLGMGTGSGKTTPAPAPPL